MQQMKKNLAEHIGDRKAVLLFTGDVESTLLMGVAADLNVKVIFIDTGYHFDEIIDYVKGFGSKIETIKNTNASVDYTVDMDKCCYQRKVETLKGYLDNINAQCLIVPFRNDERDSGIEDSYLKGIGNIEIIRPLSDLTQQDVWRKIKEYKLSFSVIYHKGHRFIDCASCVTRHGRKKQFEENKDRKLLDKEIEEKLKSLGYI